MQEAIVGDFIVLPCDLLCELDGASLLEAWMILEAGLGGATGGIEDGRPIPISVGGEKSGRRGGLGVWYETRGEDAVKGQETDFIATTPLPPPVVPPPSSSLRRDISKLVLSMPTDTLKDIMEAHSSLPIRHSLLKKHGRVKIKTTHRDAHIYFFPFWVLELMKRNERFDSVAEDVLGWWAKAGWQDGLAEKLGMRDLLEDSGTPNGEDLQAGEAARVEEVDVGSLSTTSTSLKSPKAAPVTATFASRVRGSASGGAPPIPLIVTPPPLSTPPLLAYVQPPPTPSGANNRKLIRRIDTSPLLLTTSLALAKLAPTSDPANTNPSPFAHRSKVVHPEQLPKQCRVDAGDSLLGPNVEVGERVNLKECVVGASCKIGAGARLSRCVLMEGVTVGDGVVMVGCVVGPRARVEGRPKKEGAAAVAGEEESAKGKGKARGKGREEEAEDDDKTTLKDCEVQGGYVVPWGTEAKAEKMMAFEGLGDEGDSEGGFRADEEGEGSDVGADGVGDSGTETGV